MSDAPHDNASHERISAWQAEEQAARQFSGWDLSYLGSRYTEDSSPWSYADIVREHLPGARSVLDMGTGGGEFLLSLKDALPVNTVATEGWPPNLPVARAALEPHGIAIFPYDCETDPQLPFDDARFDLILNRHEAYQADEIARVLQPGGLFITQQVDGRDLDDLSALFGVTSEYPDVTADNLARELTDAGLSLVQQMDWQGHARFADVGSLVYFLSAVPWNAPEDFSVEHYADVLLMLDARPKPLTFTIRRFLLVARKQ